MPHVLIVCRHPGYGHTIDAPWPWAVLHTWACRIGLGVKVCMLPLLPRFPGSWVLTSCETQTPSYLAPCLPCNSSLALLSSPERDQVNKGLSVEDRCVLSRSPSSLCTHPQSIQVCAPTGTPSPASHIFNFRPPHLSLRLMHRHDDSVFTCTGLPHTSRPFLPCSSVMGTRAP